MSKKNTTNSKWHKVTEIASWDDFTMDNLYALYGSLLQEPLTNEYAAALKPVQVLPYPDCEIVDEASLKILIAKSNQTIVCNALTVAVDMLRSKGAAVRVPMMGRGGQAQPCEPRGLPDWAGVYHEQDRPSNQIPGDAKLARKWSSQDIIVGLVDESLQGVASQVEWLKPLRQILTYCCWAKSRYGYVITDKELVAIRVRSRYTHSSDAILAARRNNILAFRSIPRISTFSNRQELTPNASLWWIQMLAAQSEDIRPTYVPLSMIKTVVNAEVLSANSSSIEKKQKADFSISRLPVDKWLKIGA